MGDRRLRVGTRGSALARAQTALVVDRLRARGWVVDVVRVRTEGDWSQRTPSMMLARGAFVSELERALREETIDLAVHSAKDLPTEEPPDLDLVAFPVRADPRDAVVTRDGGPLIRLPAGSRVGTESPRRRAFVLLERPDLTVTPVRGNVDTRLETLDAGEVDALILAAAGLDRLGLAGRVAEILAPERMLPAVGQGALAVQARARDPAADALRPLDDPGTRCAVLAERAFLAAMGGGCRAPFAALARTDGDSLILDGAAVEPDGSDILRGRVEGPGVDAAGLGRRLAEELLTRGAAALAGRAGAGA